MTQRLSVGLVAFKPHCPRGLAIEDYRHTAVVGVRLASGAVKYVNWIGFIDVDTAKVIKRAKAVNLEIARYSNNAGGWATDWTDLQPGQYVQGCLTVEGVYAVVATGVRIIPG